MPVKTRVTRAQYDAGLDAICDKYDRLPSWPDTAPRENAELEAYKAGVVILETTPAPAARPPARAASATPTKVAKRAARIAKVVRESLAATQAARTAARQTAPQVPARPLHEMSTDELIAETAAAYRAVGGVSPFWVQGAEPAALIRESVPPGVQQGPRGASVPAVSVPAIPDLDPARPLHDMSSEDWEQASAAWFAGAARAGHPSPFWQAR